MFALFGTLALLMLIGGLCWIVENEKPLKEPRPDERNWSINYMTDFKRWSHHG